MSPLTEAEERMVRACEDLIGAESGLPALVRRLCARVEELEGALRTAEHFMENVRQYGALRSEVDVPKLLHALGVVLAALASSPATGPQASGARPETSNVGSIVVQTASKENERLVHDTDRSAATRETVAPERKLAYCNRYMANPSGGWFICGEPNPCSIHAPTSETALRGEDDNG